MNLNPWKKHHLTLIGLAMSSLAAAAGPQAGFDVSTPVVSIPRLAAAPAVDGVITDGEWSAAAVLDGFNQLHIDTAPVERTRAWLAYDTDRLYIAVRCWMQPGARPRAEVKTTGGPVFSDDCVELFLDPLRRGVSHHFAGNSISTQFSARAMDGTWQPPGWQWQARQTDFGWEGEMSIPFAAFGLGTPKPGEEWGLLLGRTVQVPKECFSQWGGLVYNYWHAAKDYGRLRFAGPAPVLVNLGDVAAYGTDVRLNGEIHASPAAGTVRVRTRVMKCRPPAARGKEESGVMVFHEDVAETIAETDSTVDLPAGGRRKLAAPEIPAAPGLYRYEIDVTLADGTPVFAQRVPLLRLEPISVAVRRYPTAGVVDMDADLSLADNAARIVRTTCELRGKDGQAVWREEAPGLKPSFRFKGYGRLPAGDYTLTVTGRDAAGASVGAKTLPFSKAPPPAWFNNRLGAEDTVIAPWTPVRMAGRTVEIWGRRYEFGPDGLPVQITAADQPLLTAPWRLVAATAAGPLTFAPDTAAPTVTRLGDTKATVAATAAAPGGWKLRVATTVEFDGFAWSEITVTPPPAGGNLARLWLELPVSRAHANYRLPVFNDPVAIPTGGIATTVICSLDWNAQKANGLQWIGSEERGLAFCAESDAGWEPADRKREVALVPQGTATWLWRSHLVDAPVLFKAPRTFGFAWQATPVKPLVAPHAPRPVGDGWYPATPPATAAALDQFFAGAQTLGVKEAHTHEPWTEIMGYPFSFLNMPQVKAAATAARAHGVRNCLYSHPIISTLAPEWDEWGAEFSLKNPPVAAFQRQPAQDLHFVCHDTAWSDFYIWGWVRLIKEYGVGGMYFDGTYGAGVCTNPYHAHARTYADGTIVPAQPIRGARSFMLRLRRATLAADPGFFFLGHGTAPFSGQFLDYFMTGENFWVAPAGFEVPLDYLRVVLSPQWGLPRDFYRGPILEQPYIRPLALAHGYGTWSSGDVPGSETAVWRTPVWKAWDSYGIDRAEFVAYWKNDPRVRSSHPEVIASFHYRPGSVLLAVATPKRQAPAAVITLDLKALGLDPQRLQITTGDGNPVPNLPAPGADGSLRLPFPAAFTQGVYLWLRNQ
jgi:hypothetical protein